MGLLLLVDEQNVAYRAYYSSLRHHQAKPWSPLLQYASMLAKCGRICNEEYSPDTMRVIFAGESRTKLLRTQFDPTYKAHRKKTKRDEAFQKMSYAVDYILKRALIPIVRVDGYEADDVVASLTQNIRVNEKDFSTRVVIFSNDRDLGELLSRPMTVLYRAPGGFYTRKDLEKEYGVPVYAFPIYKALVGDKSDGLKGVFGWGPSLARKSISDWSWNELLEIQGQIEEYWLAMELSRLRYIPELPVESSKFKVNGLLDTIRKEMEKLYNSKDAGLEIASAFSRVDNAFNRRTT
jgi:DNA polymerase-1